MVAANRSPLSRNVIADAALDLVEEHGFDHLTMRRLGQRLNVDAMSLYYHFANKDDLLDAMLERLFDGVIPVAADHVGEVDRSDSLAVWIRAIWRMFDHPAALELYNSRLVTSAAGPRGVLWSGSRLLGRGLSPTEAAEAYRLIAAFITGFAAMNGYLSDVATAAKSDAAASDPSIRQFLDGLLVNDQKTFEVGIQTLLSTLIRERQTT